MTSVMSSSRVSGLPVSRLVTTRRTLARDQLDVVRAGARQQRRAVEQQGVGADVDLVAGPHDGRLADARAVDEGAVGAVEIDEDRPVVFQR